MNRPPNEATVKKFHYETLDKLKVHFQVIIDAYNVGIRLKALQGLTVFDYITKCWKQNLLSSNPISNT